METTSKRTACAASRQQAEARTGACQNMLQFGFKPAKYTLDGHPTRFVKGGESIGGGGRAVLISAWIIQRTPYKQWRVAKAADFLVEGGRAGMGWAPERKVDAPLFPGPVAAAMWLEVEVANGTVRFL